MSLSPRHFLDEIPTTTTATATTTTMVSQFSPGRVVSRQIINIRHPSRSSTLQIPQESFFFLFSFSTAYFRWARRFTSCSFSRFILFYFILFFLFPNVNSGPIPGI
jgi:hypothetical protein